jgi:hypothetical protein
MSRIFIITRGRNKIVERKEERKKSKWKVGRIS